MLRPDFDSLFRHSGVYEYAPLFGSRATFSQLVRCTVHVGPQELDGKNIEDRTATSSCRVGLPSFGGSRRSYR